MGSRPSSRLLFLNDFFAGDGCWVFHNVLFKFAFFLLLRHSLLGSWLFLLVLLDSLCLLLNFNFLDRGSKLLLDLSWLLISLLVCDDFKVLHELNFEHYLVDYVVARGNFTLAAFAPFRSEGLNLLQVHCSLNFV